MMIKALTGGQAAAEALRQIEPGVMAVYPITPQTPIIEAFADFVADGKVATEYVRVESEHSALSAVIGSQACGVRSTTATASQGLTYMYEVLPVASGLRLPILMNIAARAISAPINIHCDHSDVMATRDTGWIQLFAENPQEVYDLNLIGLKLAEEVSLPVMVIQDGFITSHCLEEVNILDDDDVREFVGTLKPKFSLFGSSVISVGPVALPDSLMETKEAQAKAIDSVINIYPQITKEYAHLSSRNYAFADSYQLEGAKAVLVALGSSAGTIKYVVNEMRKEGYPVGVIKPCLFRPFPYEEYDRLLSPILSCGILDRSLSFGAEAPLYTAVKLALFREGLRPNIESFIYGLGGRDFQTSDAREMFQGLLEAIA